MTATPRRKSISREAAEWSLFHNPGQYSLCSPGILILVSVVLELSALVIATRVWCFGSEFNEIVLADKNKRFTVSENNERKRLRNSLFAGCLNPIQGYDQIEHRLRLANDMANSAGMDPLSEGAKEAKKKNQEFFYSRKNDRKRFFVSWVHYLIATSLSFVLGLLFFALSLGFPISRCKKSKFAFSLIKNLVTFSGMLHYGIAYENLSSIDRLQLNYLFQDTAWFYLGMIFSASALVTDIIGSSLTAWRCHRGDSEYEEPKRSVQIEDLRSKMAANRTKMAYDKNTRPPHLAAPTAAGGAGKGATAAAGGAGKGAGATAGGKAKAATAKSRADDRRAAAVKAAASRVQPARGGAREGKDLHDVVVTPKSGAGMGGGGGNVNKSKNMANSPSWSRDDFEAKRRRGADDSALLTPEEAARVDWKKFHGAVSDRDEYGRRHIFYALPSNDNRVVKCWLSEEEATDVDWMKFHRVGGPRDPVTGRRGLLYRIPDGGINSREKMPSLPTMRRAAL